MLSNSPDNKIRYHDSIIIPFFPGIREGILIRFDVSTENVNFEIPLS